MIGLLYWSTRFSESHWARRVLADMGVSIIPALVVGLVMEQITRHYLRDELDRSRNLSQDLAGSGVVRVVDKLSDNELISGFRGPHLGKSDGDCFVVQTWIPQQEDLVNVIAEGLKRGCTVTIYIGRPDSDFVITRYLDVWPKATRDDARLEVERSISRLKSAFEQDQAEGRVVFKQYDGMTGLIVHKFGSYAWLTWMPHGRSAYKAPQICIDTRSDHELWGMVKHHRAQLDEKAEIIDV